MKRILQKLIRCQRGTATVDSILLSTAVAALAIVSFSTVRAAVVCEISDVAGSIQDINMSYAYAGSTGASAAVAGSSFQDELDLQDSAGDIAGTADNCLVLDVPPETEYVDPGSKDAPLELDWADSATSISSGLFVWQGGGFRPRTGATGVQTVEGTTAIDCDECNIGIEGTWTVRSEEDAIRDDNEEVELFVNGSSVGSIANNALPAGGGNRDVSMSFTLPAGTTSFSWLMVFSGGDGLSSLTRIGVRPTLSFQCAD